MSVDNTKEDNTGEVVPDAPFVLLSKWRFEYDKEFPKNNRLKNNDAYKFYLKEHENKTRNKNISHNKSSFRDPQKIEDVFSNLVSSRGWGSPIAIGAVSTRWKEIVGEENAEHSHVEHFVDGRLTIRCTQTAWAKQLKTLSDEFLKTFEREVGPGIVQKIEILGPKGIPSFRQGYRTVKGVGPRDTYG